MDFKTYWSKDQQVLEWKLLCSEKQRRSQMKKLLAINWFHKEVKDHLQELYPFDRRGLKKDNNLSLKISIPLYQIAKEFGEPYQDKCFDTFTNLINYIYSDKE